MRRYALFDFDGTLTRKDTTRYLLLELVKLRPWLVFHLLSLLLARMFGSSETLQYAKNRCTGRLLKRLAPEQVARVVGEFRRHVAPLIRPSILEAARDYQASGVQVIIVTASPEFAVAPIFQDDGFWCVGTRYVDLTGVYSGMLDGSACYGEGKVPALHVRGIGEAGIIVSAWSDSLSDLPMMMLADERYWVCSPASEARIRAADHDGRIIRTDP